MRFTKKMVMVPEAEYLTLLGMLKAAPGGHLQAEKAQTDSDLRRVLTDPKLSAPVKAGKYGMLQRKRQQLKTAIEARPQKVVIENPGAKAAAQADIPPYMAHEPQQNPLESEAAYETVAEEWGEQQKSPMRRRRKQAAEKQHDSPFKSIIHPRYGEELKNFVAKNKDKFHIHEDGRFDMNVAGKAINDSDYKEVLDYMMGERDGMPKGFKFLMTRLGKEPIVQQFMRDSRATSSGTGSSATTNSSDTSQSGDGKKRRRVHIVANAPATVIKAAKTKGLERKKFKPTLWAKL